jgi:predicted SprT family Zn-dependent metalloprotease
MKRVFSKKETDEATLSIVHDTLRRLGHGNLINAIKISWRQMYKEVGLSRWHLSTNGIVGCLEICFSAKLWPYMSKKQRKDTIIHEVCHIVDVVQNKHIKDVHGPSWAKLMGRMNVAAKPELRQLRIPWEVYVQLFPKCSICGNFGHNKTTCQG